MANNTQLKEIKLSDILWYELGDDVVNVGFNKKYQGIDMLTSEAITYEEFVRLLQNIDNIIMRKKLREKSVEFDSVLLYFDKFKNNSSADIPQGLIGISKNDDGSFYMFFEVVSYKGENLLKYKRSMLDKGKYVVMVKLSQRGEYDIENLQVYTLNKLRFNTIDDIVYNPILTDVVKQGLVGKSNLITHKIFNSNVIKNVLKSSDLSDSTLVANNETLIADIEAKIISKENINW